MFDFPFTEASIGTSLYCLLYYLVIVILNYRDGLNPYSYEISLRKESGLYFRDFIYYPKLR